MPHVLGIHLVYQHLLDATLVSVRNDNEDRPYRVSRRQWEALMRLLHATAFAPTHELGSASVAEASADRNASSPVYPSHCSEGSGSGTLLSQEQFPFQPDLGGVSLPSEMSGLSVLYPTCSPPWVWVAPTMVAGTGQVSNDLSGQDLA